ESGDLNMEGRVRRVVEHLKPEQPATVYLHPADLALLESRPKDGRSLLGGSAEVRLAVDPALARGDCRAETGDVSVRARLEDELADIRQGLLGGLSASEVERRKPAGEQTLHRYPDRRQTA